jgi:hypothetical protein
MSGYLPQKLGAFCDTLHGQAILFWLNLTLSGYFRRLTGCAAGLRHRVTIRPPNPFCHHASLLPYGHSVTITQTSRIRGVILTNSEQDSNDLGAFAPSAMSTSGDGLPIEEAVSIGEVPSPNYIGKSNDVTWGDHLLKEGKPLRHSHEVLCFMAAAGTSNNDIARDLGLTPGRVSVLLSNTRIRARIKEIQDAHWGANIQARFQNTVPKAMDVIDEIITGKTPDGSPVPGLKPRDQMEAAKWLLEKVTGKARQEIDIDGGNTVLQLIQALDQLKAQSVSAAGGASGNTEAPIDVTPVKQEDPLESFVNKYIPTLESEKSK